MLYGFRPLSLKIEVAVGAVLPVSPGFAVGAAVKPSKASKESVLAWLEENFTCSGSSNRPRNKDVVVDVGLVDVLGVVVDWDMVIPQNSKN